MCACTQTYIFIYKSSKRLNFLFAASDWRIFPRYIVKLLISSVGTREMALSKTQTFSLWNEWIDSLRSDMIQDIDSIIIEQTRTDTKIWKAIYWMFAVSDAVAACNAMMTTNNESQKKSIRWIATKNGNSMWHLTISHSRAAQITYFASIGMNIECLSIETINLFWRQSHHLRICCFNTMLPFVPCLCVSVGFTRQNTITNNTMSQYFNTVVSACYRIVNNTKVKTNQSITPQNTLE